MKKLIATSLLLSLYLFCSAQLDLSTNLAAPLGGAIALGVEVPVSKKIGLELLTGIGTGVAEVDELEIWDYNWFPTNIMGKYYFKPKSTIDGLLALGFVRLSGRTYDYKGTDLGFDPNYSTFRYGAGIGAGYKKVFDFGLMLEIYIGFGYEFGRNNSDITPDFSTQIPRADWDKVLQLAKLGIGYRFGG